jgi:hypothetical protein
MFALASPFSRLDSRAVPPRGCSRLNSGHVFRIALYCGHAIFQREQACLELSEHKAVSGLQGYPNERRIAAIATDYD